MTEYIIFRQCTMETLRVTRSPLPLLQDGDWTDERITREKEEELVRWLAAHPQARALLLEELRVSPGSRVATHVTEPVLPKGSKPGDIDILLCHADHPNEAVAIECKRVKVTPLDTNTNQVNKIDAIGVGVVQANQLRDRGFHRTFLCVISAIDAAAQTHWNVPNRGLDAATGGYDARPTFKRIVEFPGREDLHRDVGIIFIEIVQPTNRAINELVTLRICVHHGATPQDQRTELTNRIRALVARAT